MSESKVLSWFWQIIVKYWKTMVLLTLLTLVLAVASTAFPILWQILIDQAVEGDVNYGFSVLFLGLLIVDALPFYVLRSRFFSRYEFETKYQMFKHLLRLPVAFHKEKESTKAMLEANKGVGAGNMLISTFLTGHLLSEIPVALFAWWYIASHSVWAAVIFLFFLFAFFCFSYVLGNRVAKVEEEYNEIDNTLSSREREVLQYIETVKLHLAEKQEEDWYLGFGKKVLALENRRNNYYGWFSFVSGLAHMLPFFVALVLFLPEVANGTLTVGTLLAIQIFSTRAVAPIGFLGSIYRDVKIAIAKLKPALKLMTIKPTVVEAEHAISIGPLRHELALRDVTFTYPGSSQPTIKDFSLTVSVGEKIAIVGKTGSGKSTLARLLVRFYDPDRGIITMDGTDLRNITFDSLYRQISYVSQEVPIFSGTIGENVKHGLPNTPENLVISACANASANFIFGEGRGLQTQVGELGEKLSGGERQRLALARIFLRSPSVLILDEATSSLDRITEREVQEAFDGLLRMNGNMTIIVIAHRIATVKNAGRIVVLDQGRIIGMDTHDELLNRCSLYQELCHDMAK